MNFNSHTDLVVSMAVALVNLLTKGEDRSRAYEPPTGAERASRLNALFKSARSRTEVTEAEAEAFGAVATDLRAVFAAIAVGDIDDAAHRVNDMLAATGAHPALERHDDEPWHIHFHSADERRGPRAGRQAALPAWPSSSAASCMTGSACAPRRTATGSTWTRRATGAGASARPPARTG